MTNRWLVFISKFLFVSAVILWVSLFLAALTGCKVTQQKCQKLYPPPPADTSGYASMFVKETVHDTVIIRRPDASAFAAIVQCDQNNQVLVEELTRQKGMVSHLRWELDNSQTKQVIRVRCDVDSQSIYLQFKTRDTTSREIRVVKQPYPVVVEKDLSRWQRFKVDWGDWMFGLLWLLIIYGGFRAVKTILSFKSNA